VSIFFKYRRELFCLLLTTAIITSGLMQSLVLDIREKNMPEFSIMRLECPASEEALTASITQLHANKAIKEIKLNLIVDYVFMPAIYLSIAAWLLMIRTGAVQWLRWSLLFAAVLQLLPWLFDIIENNNLLYALQSPGYKIKMPLQTFKYMVFAKFLIAVSGALFALVVCIFKYFSLKRQKNNTG